ncbi:LPS-assembly protein LptD [Azohydromonas aeria]|uniref:LPS-assembly protein LptD n=1 Tax=Azohydromonas aeria TaxID=2590212 RepID=UPI001E45B710|nr:LPS assembly protein LptD [Azohydromonas aeria]
MPLPVLVRPAAVPPPRPRAERLLALALLAGLPPAALAQALPATSDTAPPPAASAPAAAAAPAAATAASEPRRAAPGPRAERSDEPVDVEADRITGRTEVDLEAQGDVDVRQGDVRVQADRASFRQDTQLLQARGNVRLEQRGNRAKGTELEIRLDTREGFIREPEYFIALTEAGGRAERVDFLGRDRARIVNGSYTSCGLDGTGAPAWLLTADQVDLDQAANEGVARGGVLRFMGVPILAAPRITFPLSDARKSGWLPPTISIDSRSGLEVTAPYYWNIAPNRDATLAPVVALRRGVGLNSEYRYLERDYQGQLNLNLMPNDQVARRSRWSLGLDHAGTSSGIDYRLTGVRVSDDAYWKDFPRFSSQLNARASTALGGTMPPRLLPLNLRAERRFGHFDAPEGQWTTYARTLSWQVLQTADTLTRITPPYERLPQIGVQGGLPLAGGLRLDLQSEFNRFSLAPTADATLNEGSRLHAVAAVSRPWATSWGFFRPKLSLNAASYATDRPMADGRSSASRVIPTFSADTGLVFERPATLFGRAVNQTLEPRLLYVRTPYRDQSMLPKFDTAIRDLDITSMYQENPFSGVDRVADANQVSAGATSRLLDARDGRELGRLGLVQRVLFQDQRITAVDGETNTQRLSDLLLLGSGALTDRWSADGTLQYSHETRQMERGVVGTRYSPGPFRTLSLRYTYQRDTGQQLLEPNRLTDATRQLDVGWQWPVYGPEPGTVPRAGINGGCGGGTVYSVGRVNYSVQASRLTDAIVGFEYDAGCWVGRIVGERLSTGRSEAVTRLLFQLELVGLSRLGSSPLQVLRDNIPGYRLLRDDPSLTSRPPAPPASYE